MGEDHVPEPTIMLHGDPSASPAPPFPHEPLPGRIRETAGSAHRATGTRLKIGTFVPVFQYCEQTRSLFLRVQFHSSPAHLNRKLLLTTLTLLSAIAAPAIIGSKRKPLNGYNTPAAMGMPMML